MPASLNQTPAEVMNVAGVIKTQMVMHEATTPEAMERAAYVDMVREKIGKIDHSTATGRYEYLMMLKDPKNAEAIAEIESMMISPEQRTRQEMIDAKAEGGGSLRAQAQGGKVTGPYDPKGVTSDNVQQVRV